MAEKIIDDLLAFLTKSPTPYHAVDNVCEKLFSNGFNELNEKEPWSLKPGKFLVKRNDSSIIAFILPEGFENCHLQIFSAHTDSPNLKLKPHPASKVDKYLQLNIEPYGGILYHTWLDRDLSVAGQVMVSTPGGPEARLVNLDRAIARIPNLAIHLDPEVNRKGAVFNPQKEMSPIVALSTDLESFEKLLADEAGSALEDLLSFDLSLYDVQPAATGGLNNEFIFSARLDNLACCHAGVTALVRSESGAEKIIPMVCLFDHEEVGSHSAEGAASNFLGAIIDRIYKGLDEESRQVIVRKSYMISADMAHGYHPNFQGASDENHRPVLNDGPVIKLNHNQRYATSAETSAWFISLCRQEDIAYQIFTSRNDKPCGSTIGPALSTRFGINTIDVGNSMLSMHSIRETSGSKDHEYMIELATSYFNRNIFNNYK